MVFQESRIKIDNKQVLSYLEQFKDSLFFDIETTGLYWKNSHLYLIGAASCENSGWTVKQWFLDQPAYEAGLLDEFSGICKGKKRIVHYNGNGFDIPYLQKKYSFYQKINPFASLESLDLYRRARPFQKLFNLSSMKLKSVEQFMNLNRKDAFTGKELIRVYTDYLRSRDTHLLGTLMLHNLEDVTALIQLLPILSYESVKEGRYSVGKSVLKDHTLTIDLKLDSPVPISVSEEFEFYSLSLCDNSGSLAVTTKDCMMKHFFSDYKNYYYLPLEDEAIHKSIGAFVDREHREKAKPANCYQKMDGVFLPQLTKRFQPIFYEDYKTSPAYFLYKEDILRDKEALYLYTYDYLSAL